MGFTLKVEGPSTIELGTTSVVGVKFRTDIPHDSNARSTDMGSTVEITGKILTAVLRCIRQYKAAGAVGTGTS